MSSVVMNQAALAAPSLAACGGRTIRLVVNGEAHERHVENWVSILDLLRDRLGLTGTKKGCDHGQCGACTVILDGRRINSCLSLAAMHDGATIMTVEGLAQIDGEGDMHPLQSAFIAHDAYQCGYCTPGQLCSAAALLLFERPPANAAELRERMSGNLCRCGAYPQIVKAVSAVLASRVAAGEAVR
jgi:xanthine dehydrogenase YagT iron-sulfur-binding subunit